VYEFNITAFVKALEYYPLMYWYWLVGELGCRETWEGKREIVFTSHVWRLPFLADITEL